MAKRKKPLESVDGPYIAIPLKVMDSVAFKEASHTARSLMIELIRQHNGKNNGHLQLTTSWLKKRGWTSADVIQRAKSELIERNLIIKTRLGGMNMGPDWFAITWLPITNFEGLDIASHQYHRGAWHFMDTLPVAKMPKVHSVGQNDPLPPNGTAGSPAIPAKGTKTALFGNIAVPPNGNNVLLPYPTRGTTRRIVGAKGRSGKSSGSRNVNSKSDQTGSPATTSPMPDGFKI